MLKAVLNVPSAEPKDIRWFYNQYASMLLGYINGIVQDHQKSEEHLVTILSSFVKEVILQEKSKLNIWMELRQYTQGKLKLFTAKEHHLKSTGTTNKGNLDLLDDLQRKVFCAVYYHGKSISYLAETMHNNETEIRNQLKLAIDKMRRASGN
ncbi:hypothetical protein [Pedobacter miscanthi]|uniref:Sigma-70 family RNA polymerase sigma factor n=1 Tax=Pedobacter miscanthi TaxID=2259170 RepID=A0A366KZ10_9SPHI|nr:hypothetical protein [Pedobacter miscanthi]RBQ06304.1 hypothetical protein DRW42_14565 [Pedobacter miscanthi]